MTSMAAAYVSSTDPAVRDCPACDGPALVAEMHAVGAEGTVRIVWVWSCDNCGGLAVCAFCSERMADDGAAIWQHVVKVHADG